MKFDKLVSIKRSGCSKCFSLIYSVPCQIDKSIASAFEKEFGKPVYPIKAVKFLKIQTDDGFVIEGRVGAKILKFSIPKKHETSDFNKIKKKEAFDNCLITWLKKKLKIDISK